MSGLDYTEPTAKTIAGVTDDWELVIGMEVHAQVASQAKLFSGASTGFGAEPNSNVSLVDAAMPGMLPVINDFCVEQAVRTVFMRVNLLTLEQSPLSRPITSFVQPLKWTEDNTAILFTSDRQNGTWKIMMDSGQVVKVAAATYLGHLRQR